MIFITKNLKPIFKHNLKVLVLTLLITLTRQRKQHFGRSQFKNFTITKYRKHSSIDPATASKAQLQALKVVRSESYLGSTMSMYNQTTAPRLVITIYYRKAKQDSVSSSQMIQLSLSGKLGSEEGQFFLQTNPRSDLNGFLFINEVDSDFNIFRGKVISKNNTKLRKLKVENKIEVATSKRNGSEVKTGWTTYKSFISPIELDMYLEDEEHVYHYLIGKEAVVTSESSAPVWMGLIFSIFVIGSCFVPSGTLLLFEVFSQREEYFTNKNKEIKIPRNNVFPGTFIFRLVHFLAVFLILIMPDYHLEVKNLVVYNTYRFFVFSLIFGRCLTCFYPFLNAAAIIKAIKDSKNQKKFIGYYLGSLSVLGLIWLVACYFFMRLILRSSFLYCGLVLIDLFVHEIPEKVKKRGFFLAWVVIMLEMVFIQILSYLGFFLVSYYFHFKIPVLLLFYIIPDAILTILMLPAFYLAWRFQDQKNAKKVVSPKKVIDVKLPPPETEKAKLEISENGRNEESGVQLGWGNLGQESVVRESAKRFGNQNNIQID